jgi:hypothetical protein
MASEKMQETWNNRLILYSVLTTVMVLHYMLVKDSISMLAADNINIKTQHLIASMQVFKSHRPHPESRSTK